MTRLRAAVFTFALAITFALATTARADTATTIVVLAPDGDAFGKRLIAELESIGLHALRVDPPSEPPTRASLEAAAKGANASAAIRATPSPGGVEIWIADRVTGKTVLREVHETDLDRDALALRTVELLRASLLEASLATPPPGDVPATPELQAKLQLLPPEPIVITHPTPLPARHEERPRRPVLDFAIGGGALVSPGGFGPSAMLDVSVVFSPVDHVGLVAFGSVPLGGARFENAEGHVTLSTTLVGGAARIVFTTWRSRVAPSADLGLAAVIFHSTGTSTSNLAGHDDGAATTAPFVRFGLGFAITPRLRARVDLLGGVVAPAASIQFAGVDRATWGLPFFLPSAGFDAAIF